MSYRDNYKLIDFSRDIPMPVRERSAPKRSDLPFPTVISDVMDPVQSQVDGKMYDSKAAIRASYREHGVVEVGNDPARNKPFVKPRTSRKEIKETVDKARARFSRGERVDRKPRA